MNYLDLFSGIGGFALGARWAGIEFENHFNSDIEDYANKVYKKNFPESIQLGDITKIDWHELKQMPGEWIVAGGFPCQDISISKKDAEGINGKRSGLWSEMFAAISILRPNFTIIENVGAITFRGLDRVLGNLAEIGYAAEWQNICPSKLDANITRDRIFIIAYPDKIIDSCSEKQVLWKQVLQKQFTRGFTQYRNRSDLPESRFYRKSDGISNWLDRLECLGNSIIPQIAEILFKRIRELNIN